MVRRLALVASALSGLLLLAAWLISQRVLHPAPKEEDYGLSDFDLPAEEVSFPSRDGTRLAGSFIPARGRGKGRSPAIVLSHGWGRSRAELLPHADLLHRAGFALLAFDYRHRGASDGDAITMGLRERDDLRGALDALANRPEVDAERIGVFGMSLGGVIAILVSADDDRVRALVAEAPFATPAAIMTRSLRHYFHMPSFPIAMLTKWVIEKRLGGSLDTLQAEAMVGKLSPRPVMLIADECDAVVGADEARRVFEAAGEPKQFWFVPGADHACGWQAAPQEYERRVTAFFKESLGVAKAASAQAKRRARRG